MSKWIPATEPPALCPDELGILKSLPALVYSEYRAGPAKMLIATLEKWGDYPPTWYSNCSEHWNLHDTVKFWMPLPNQPERD